ncbi:hypothetical protein [Actinomadura sp. 9N215]|uniref:hypothetical protein n=1 Tax=Actinomadura sp. 9N215 TaxID=3375150 RepID=UPI003789D61E
MTRKRGGKLTRREMFSAWCIGARDGRRGVFTLPTEQEQAESPAPPTTAAIEDRYRRAVAVSRRVFGDLYGANRGVVERLERLKLVVIHEADAVGKLTPAAAGRFRAAYSEWVWAVNDGHNRAQVLAASADLWIARYWRALSSHHQGLRKNRERHLDRWTPALASQAVSAFWADPVALLYSQPGSADATAASDAGQLRRALEIVESYGNGSGGQQS